MRDEFSTKLIGTHSSIALGRPCLCSSSPPATQWGLCITTQGADYQPRPLIHVPLAQLTHKSGLLRKYQFLSLVLLSSVVKPHQSSLRPLLTHGVPVSPSTHSWSQVTWSQIKTFLRHSKLDFLLFSTCRIFPEIVSPSQMHSKTNVLKSCLSPPWLSPIP